MQRAAAPCTRTAWTKPLGELSSCNGVSLLQVMGSRIRHHPIGSMKPALCSLTWTRSQTIVFLLLLSGLNVPLLPSKQA